MYDRLGYREEKENKSVRMSKIFAVFNKRKGGASAVVFTIYRSGAEGVCVCI